jgi:hypothetical protein
MTDTPRCEPPEELRGRDGWHWLSRQGCEPELIRWHLANDGETWLWSVPGLGTAGRAWMVAQGFRYIAPVATPAEGAVLRAERDELRAEKAELVESVEAALRQRANLRAEVARLREAIESAANAIETADPETLVDTLWMPDEVSPCETVVDHLRAALSQPEHNGMPGHE